MYGANDIIIFDDVYLWNDFDKIKGSIHLSKKQLDFIVDGFELTHLELSIMLSDIRDIEFYKLFNISLSGLRISTFNDKNTIFIVEDAKNLKKQIEYFKSFLL